LVFRNSDDKYQKVGKKNPILGLYDMHGNVADGRWINISPTITDLQITWRTVEQGNQALSHAARGGSWQDDRKNYAAPLAALPIRLENAGPATAQKHLVSHRCAVIGFRIIRP